MSILLRGGDVVSGRGAERLDSSGTSEPLN